MLPSRRLLLTASLMSLPVAAVAQVFQLVTPEEAAAGRRPEHADLPTRAIRIPDPPEIEVVAPGDAQTLSSPLAIRLRFRSPDGTPINPASFRANYGGLGLDITQRLMERAYVDASGMAWENVAIPAGSHRITVQIADAAGRIGERSFRFTIAAR